jgi:hypothetical protein
MGKLCYALPATCRSTLKTSARRSVPWHAC